MLIHWIWLSTRPALNDRQKKAILETFGDPESVFFADKGTLAQIENISEEGRNALADKSLLEAEEILCQCVDRQIRICTFHDGAYPERLKHIMNPPLVLYYKGYLPDMDSMPVIAAVGTRKASAYGLNIAQRMGYQIAACGGLVVSGVAEGIDGMTMQGALLGGGTVVGVLGSGVDIVYPKINKQLFADTEHNGCLLSEFPPGTPPYKGNFPKRNRIISGLSNGVVVIEAPERSGSLITARRALEQGRDVFVVPGNVDIPNFDGSNALLCDGAIPARNGWDVIAQYEVLYPGKVHPFNAGTMLETITEPEKNMQKVAQKSLLPTKNQLSDKKKDKKPIDKQEKPPYSDLKDILPKLSDTQRSIVELLTSERLVDDIIAESGLPAGKVSATLTMLEIKGIIKRLPGKRIALK